MQIVPGVVLLPFLLLVSADNCNGFQRSFLLLYRQNGKFQNNLITSQQITFCTCMILRAYSTIDLQKSLFY
jgi:hypothetical protein